MEKDGANNNYLFDITEERFLERARNFGMENLKMIYSFIKVISLTTATIVILIVVGRLCIARIEILDELSILVGARLGSTPTHSIKMAHMMFWWIASWNLIEMGRLI